MSRTKSAAVWFACGLLGVLTFGTSARASWSDLEIAKIEFQGVEQYSASELEKYTKLEVGKPYDATQGAEDCAAIVRHYQEHGYPFATCSQKLEKVKLPLPYVFYPSDFIPRQNHLVYTINEGPKVKVRRVEFTGNAFVGGDVLLDQIESHKRGSSRANFALVHEDVLRLIDYYRSFGYLDVAVSYELQWNLNGGDAIMMFHIDEGERYKNHD